MTARLLLVAILLGGAPVSKAGNCDFLALTDTLNPPTCVTSPDVSVLCDQFDASLLVISLFFQEFFSGQLKFFFDFDNIRGKLDGLFWRLK